MRTAGYQTLDRAMPPTGRGNSTLRSCPIEPPPLTERFPWLIYLVLTLACLSLLGILTAMGRKLIERYDARIHSNA